MKSKQTIATILHRFFELLPIFQKRKIIYIYTIFFLRILLLGLDLLSLAMIAPFITLIARPNIIQTNSLMQLLYNFFGFQESKYFILSFGIVSVFIFIFGRLMFYFAVLLQQKIQRTLTVDLTEIVFKQILHSSYEWHLKKNSGEILTAVNHQTIGLSSFITHVVTASSFAVILIAVALFLLFLYPIAFLVIVVFMGSLVFLIHTRSKKIIYSMGKNLTKATRQTAQIVKETLESIADIKLFCKENYYQQKLTTRVKKSSDSQFKIAVIIQAIHPILQSLLYIGVLCYIIFIILVENDFDKVISSGAFFLAIAYRSVPFINSLLGNLSNIQASLYNLDHLKDEFKFFEVKQKTLPKKIVPKKINFQKQIVLKNISYRYSGTKKDVLKNLDLTIKKGSLIGIIGKTGEGKSTLIKLMLSLLQPQNGNIFIDNKALQIEHLQDWYRQIGYVPQKIFISNDNLIKNIAFGESETEINFKKLKTILKLPWLASFVKQLPQAENTILQEEGKNLSGGQIQRIAIARALYKNVDLLIFDEATNALDTQTEKMVLKTIKNLHNKITIIMIAHSLKTLKSCDCIYTLKQGSIVLNN